MAGQWVDASVAFDRAADLDAAPPAATLAAARTLLGTHRLDDAVYRARRAVALAQGQINRAVPLFERALALDPRYPTAAAQLGWIASRRGDDERAAPLFEVAVASDRDPARLAQYRQALGWSYLRLGRGALAREQFTQALQLDPGLHSARDGLAALGPVRVSAR